MLYYITYVIPYYIILQYLHYCIIVVILFRSEDMVERRYMCEPFTSHCPGSHARGPVCTLQEVGCAELASVRAALPAGVARVPGGCTGPAGVAMDTARLELRKAGADEELLQVSAEVRRLQRASRLEQGRVRRVLDRVS